MTIRVLVTSFLACGFAIFQSTTLSKLVPSNVFPDIAMMILVTLAMRYGPIPGEFSGFLVGLSIDTISLAPLGFHAFIFVLIGYLSGKLRSYLSSNLILVSIVAVMLATLVKYVSAILLSFFFGLNLGLMRYFSLLTIWELLANIVLAPLIFFAIFSIYDSVDRHKEHTIE